MAMVRVRPMNTKADQTIEELLKLVDAIPGNGLSKIMARKELKSAREWIKRASR
jgi:hypothetical protein